MGWAHLAKSMPAGTVGYLQGASHIAAQQLRLQSPLYNPNKRYFHSKEMNKAAGVGIFSFHTPGSEEQVSRAASAKAANGVSKVVYASGLPSEHVSYIN